MAPHGEPDPGAARGCLGMEALDALAAEPEAPPDPETAGHLESCTRCRALLDEMRSANRFLRRFKSGTSHDGGPAPDAGDIHVRGYEVVGMLAFGGQGAVYRAVQSGTGRTVAIKVPLGDALRRPSTRYRFQREIELTARLDHPGIVRVIGPCELDDGRVGCVMEFIEGQPFDRWAAEQRREGRGAIPRIVAAGADVADAIAYAHQRAVLHRDIKPSNVVVTPAGGAHVLDFGLAKALGESADSFATRTGAFVGTLSYSAPEQISEGADAIDLRTDVYALGLLLFQALTGRLPHASDAPTAEILRQIRETAPPRPSSLTHGIGDELDAVLLKALAKEKDRRYASAAELRDDLRAWLEGGAVRARIDSRWYVLRKTLARHRRAFAVAGLVLAAVVGGAGVSAYNMISAAESQRREQYETLRAASEITRADAVQQVIDELLPMAGSGAGPPRSNLDRLDAKLEAGLLRDRPLVESSVRALLATIYADRAAFPLAEYHYRQALWLAQREQGDDHPGTAQLANRLAGILLERGKLDEAEALAREALRSRLASLGPRHADVAASLITLGRVELRRGDAPHAREHADQAAEILSVAPTATGAQALASATLRAQIADAQGRPAEALQFATEALRRALLHYSDEHPNVTHALRDYAQFTGATGDADTAARAAALADALSATRTADRPASVWEALIGIKARVLGPRAPELATSYTFLGLAREREGDHAGAVEAHYAAQDILQQTQGEDSLAAADCSYYLQYPLMRLGRTEEWCALLERRYRVYRREFLGRQNLGIVVAHREWAAGLANLGRDDQAETELHATVQEIRELCYSDPIELLRAHATLAEVLGARGQTARAEQVARAVLEQAGPPQAEERQRVALVLAMAAAERGEFDLAAPLLEDHAQLRTLDSPLTFGEMGSSERMVRRIIRTYADAGIAEPPPMAAIRRRYMMPAP